MGVNISKIQEFDLYANQLDGFGGTMKGSYYTPEFYLIGFVLHNPRAPFTILRLDELLLETNPWVNVTGTLEKISFDAVKSEINEYFGYPGVSFDSNNSDEKIQFPEMRELVFWHIIGKISVFPPDQCYQYKEMHGQPIFKQNFLVRSFAVILIKENKGIFLTIGIGDD